MTSDAKTVPTKFIFEVTTNTGHQDAVGYLPFDGAEFCAHRHLTEPSLWVVSHVRTTLKLPIDACGTEDEAVALAGLLSKGCPSAKAVEWDGTQEGTLGKASGPVMQLAAEVKAIVAARAA